MDQQPRIRKSLVALKGTDERRGYFYCLKLLGVLPPPPNSDFKDWGIITPPTLYKYQMDQNTPIPNYKPRCLHDVLIASHASSCEHISFYFAFYHRHLMVLTELFLNFAHQVLRGGQAKLKQVYPSPQFDFLYNAANKPLWTAVFDVYSKLKGIPDQVANHYWNPTDFLSNDDLSILEEVAPKESSSDPIDVLYQNICKCYPWEVNVPTRWYADPSEYDYEDLKVSLPQQSGPNYNPFFYMDKVTYTSQQNDFANGQLDPRVNPTVYGYNSQFLTTWGNDNVNMNGYNNYKSYDQQKKNYSLNSIPANELRSNYGAKSQSTQYITSDEATTHGLSPTYSLNYNINIPHYQLARSLFNPSIDVQSFFENPQVGIELSHNYMHNLQRVIMENGLFSVNSFIFWPYHSWIDAELEIYMRIQNSKPGVFNPFAKLSKLLNENYGSLPSTLHSTLQLALDGVLGLQSYVNNQLSWNISGDNINKNSVGAYPVVEYISPQVHEIGGSTFKKFSASFCARDYILTRDHIRISNDFNDIYHKFYLGKLNPGRYYFFDNINGYNFNYNYQIGSDPSQLGTRLNNEATNIPQYLADMRLIWQPNATVRANAVKKAVQVSINAKRPKPLKQEKLSKEPHHPQQQSTTQNASFDNIENTQLLEVRKLFNGGLRLFASYPPNTHNGFNPVLLKIQQDFSKIAHILNKQDQEILKLAIEKGLLVHKIFIFGKSSGASFCPKCKDNKTVHLDLDEFLRERVPRIWKKLHQSSLNQILYDSENPHAKVNCLYNTISLVENPKFTDYRLVKGAEEIEIQVVSTSKNHQNNYFRVDAECYSVKANKIKNVLSRKHYTFNKTIDFLKIFDVDNDNESNYFDHYIYKTLKVWVSIGEKKSSFKLDLPNFQRLLRLKLTVSEHEKGISLILEDTDYQAKQAFYKAASKI